MKHSLVKFSKMHGLGNDVVIIDTLSQQFAIEKIPIRKLSNRHVGIGFDQLILIEPSKHSDFFCRIFNADGSEAEQCGNGMRCVARFLHEEKISTKKNLDIETKAGIIKITVNDFTAIKVNMGIPQLETTHQIKIGDHALTLFSLSMGNPHVILSVKSLENTPVADWGPIISRHTLFPRGTNVGFMEIINRQHIRLRTFERGAGETFACGSNSCAAVVMGIENHVLDSKVKVELALGELWIEWQGENHSVDMIGPAEKVFSGVLDMTY